MPRLGYRKSRNGCEKCRQRRCDEKRPCGACVRHAMPCSLSQPVSPPAARSTSRHEFDVAVAHANNNVELDAHETLAYPDAAVWALPGLAPKTIPQSPAVSSLNLSKSSLEDADSQDQADWATDLELMHHWSTQAYLTLPRATEVAHIWQIEIVKIALANEHLLHQILAFSAFHLACLHPDRRRHYSIVAWQHQSDAAQGFRAALATTSPNTCHDALFASASLLVTSAFARQAICTDGEDNPHLTLEDIVDIFTLVKGMNAIIDTAEDVVKRGRLAHLFNMSSYAPHMAFWDEMSEKVQHLSILLRQEEVDRIPAIVVDNEVFKFLQAMKHSLTTAPLPELRLMVTWPIIATNDFVALLLQRNPMALALLAYYCVVIHESEARAWYTRGLSSRLITALEMEISPKWREAIEWPVDRIRQQPSSIIDPETGAAVL